MVTDEERERLMMIMDNRINTDMKGWLTFGRDILEEQPEVVSNSPHDSAVSDPERPDSHIEESPIPQ